MKLELKHLAPYFPYKLNMFNLVTKKCSVMDILTLDNSIIKEMSKKYKPVFRPFSDLTKEIEHNGEKFVPRDVLLEDIKNNRDTNHYDFLDGEADWMVLYMPYKVVQKLFEWHFDVSGLIEEELAIDMNSIK